MSSWSLSVILGLMSDNLDENCSSSEFVSLDDEDDELEYSSFNPKNFLTSSAVNLCKCMMCESNYTCDHMGKRLYETSL